MKTLIEVGCPGGSKGSDGNGWSMEMEMEMEMEGKFAEWIYHHLICNIPPIQVISSSLITSMQHGTNNTCFFLYSAKELIAYHTPEIHLTLGTRLRQYSISEATARICTHTLSRLAPLFSKR